MWSMHQHHGQLRHQCNQMINRMLTVRWFKSIMAARSLVEALWLQECQRQALAKDSWREETSQSQPTTKNKMLWPI